MIASQRCLRAWTAVLVLTPLSFTEARAQGGGAVMDTAVEVLDTLTTQGDRIPPWLLGESHAVVIIPDVVKGGLILGVRRGHGVVVVRDANGAWMLPVFITLTGGSIGWQAGIQATDLVLIFKNRRSIQNLMSGKLTIGVDASAAAGPVGRKAKAATDGRLAAEIYSYSRSRGLFAGVSIDGATLTVDRQAQQDYYGSGLPPTAAQRLMAKLGQFSQGVVAGDGTQAGLSDPAGLLQQLAAADRSLTPLLDDAWRQYLRLPLPAAPASDGQSLAALQSALGRYNQVARDGRYTALNQRSEFRTTLALLQRYLTAVTPRQSRLQLPPPPGAVAR